MSQQTVSDELTTSAGVASAIAKHAMSYGIDIEPICKALELEPNDLQSLTTRVSLDRVCRLLETCAVLSNDECFGLKCAQIFVPGSSGSFGYGVMTAPTVRHFVQFLADHTPVMSQTSLCELHKTELESIISWTFSPLIVKRDQYVDMTVAIHMRHLRRMIGEDIDTVTVGLERARPRSPSLFREKLSRNVNFDMEVNTLRIPHRLLDRENPRGDANLFRLMDFQCRALQSGLPEEEDFVEQVRRYIRQRVSEPILALDDVAGYFGLSERTFQRRLAELGTTLNDLRDEERRYLCLTLLTESNLSISAICYRLGYSAPSAFTRSVNRWFGMSPRGLRDRGMIDDEATNRPSLAAR